MKLVDEIQHFWKFWTVKIQGISFGFAAAWAVAPPEWRDAIPKKVLVVLMVLFGFATVTARAIKQDIKKPDEGDK